MSREIGEEISKTGSNDALEEMGIGGNPISFLPSTRWAPLRLSFFFSKNSLGVSVFIRDKVVFLFQCGIESFKKTTKRQMTRGKGWEKWLRFFLAPCGMGGIIFT